MEVKTWKEIKDNVYGETGTERRDQLERDFESFKIGLLIKKAREEKELTQLKLFIKKENTFQESKMTEAISR